MAAEIADLSIYEDKFWAIIEDHGRLKLSDLSKNILKFTAMVHRDELSNYENDSRRLSKELEEKVRCGSYKINLLTTVTQSTIDREPKKYFGNYYGKENEFRFSLGERNKLEILVKLVTDRSETRKIRESTWKRLAAIKQGTQTRAFFILPGQQVAQEDLETDRKKIILQIAGDKMRAEKFDDFLRGKLEDLEVNILLKELGDGSREVFALVKCPICAKKIKASKRKDRTGKSKGWWLTWNFVAHFLNHKNQPQRGIVNAENEENNCQIEQ